MVSRSKPKPFVVFFCLVFTGQFWQVKNQTLDEDRDAMIQFHDVLTGLAHSILDSSNDVKAGVPEAEGDLRKIQDSESRMKFEVRVMRVEHDAEVLAGKRNADTVTRGQKITEAENSLQKNLAPKIKSTTKDLANLQKMMQETTLSDKDVAARLKLANEKLKPDEHISIPKASEMYQNVVSEITKIQPVFQRRASTNQMTIISAQLTSIKNNFREMLTGNQVSDFAGVARLTKEIDASLVQIKQLNILDTQARMEL